MPSWENLTYFHQLDPPNQATIEAELDSDGGSPDGSAVCYAQTPETLAEDGAYISVIIPFRGPELWVGLTSEDGPSCTGSPCEFAHDFEAGIHFSGTDFQVQKNGTNQGSAYAYSANGVFKFTRVDDQTITVHYGSIEYAELTFGSPLPALRLAVVAGSTYTTVPEEEEEEPELLQPRVRLHLYEEGEEGGGGGEEPVNLCGEDAPRLLIVGQLEPEVGKGFARLPFNLGRGHTPSVLVGHSEGGRFYKYVFKALPDRPGDANFLVTDDEDGDTVKTWAEYLPDFFRRRMNDCLPFKVMDQRTGEDVCMVFAPEQEDELSLRLIGRDVYACELRLKAFRDVAD